MDGGRWVAGGAQLGGGKFVFMQQCVCIAFFVVVDRFYIALFSALEQTHCARTRFYTSE